MWQLIKKTATKVPESTVSESKILQASENVRTKNPEVEALKFIARAVNISYRFSGDYKSEETVEQEKNDKIPEEFRKYYKVAYSTTDGAYGHQVPGYNKYEIELTSEAFTDYKELLNRNAVGGNKKRKSHKKNIENLLNVKNLAKNVDRY